MRHLKKTLIAAALVVSTGVALAANLPGVRILATSERLPAAHHRQRKPQDMRPERSAFRP